MKKATLPGASLKATITSISYATFMMTEQHGNTHLFQTYNTIAALNHLCLWAEANGIAFDPAFISEVRDLYAGLPGAEK